MTLIVAEGQQLQYMAIKIQHNDCDFYVPSYNTKIYRDTKIALQYILQKQYNIIIIIITE